MAKEMQTPKITFIGKPNLQRFAETWVAILAAKQGLEVVPGSVKVVRREEAKA